MRKWLAVCGLIGAVAYGVAGDREVGFRETFALAKDRAQALKQLLRGTDDYYYFHCLHYLNERQLDKYEGMMKQWKGKRKGNHELRVELERRYAVLLFEKDPDKSLALLRKDHKITFAEAQHDVAGKTFPSQLPNDALALSKFAESGPWQTSGPYPFIRVKEKLTTAEISELVKSLQWPDLPNLVDLVVTDLLALEAKREGGELGLVRADRPNPDYDGIGFGTRPIHSRLTLRQLDELLVRLPVLRAQKAFIETYLVRLQPSADSGWMNSAKEERDYLDRLWKFVKTLPPAHNSLKVHVLNHRLRLNLTQGRFDRQEFLAYVKLPRAQEYMASKYVASQSKLVNLRADYSKSTLLGSVDEDEDLIEAHLFHFFTTDPDYKEFAKYMDEGFLRRAFATARLQHEEELTQEWHKWLTTDAYRDVTDRAGSWGDHR